MTKGQQALLDVIRKCVEEKKSFTFDMVVSVYYYNVRSQYWKSDTYDYVNSRWNKKPHDILKSYKKGIDGWFYKMQIRQWLVSNIGILVLKNQLVIVPTIDLGEEGENGQ